MLNPEYLLLPFEASPLPAGPWLVFAPHADDETFGMGGSLLKASEQGLETHVIVMTDGALGGTDPGLVETRREEVRAATNLLGVKSLQCWDEPDRGLTVCARLIDKIQRVILELATPTVFFPGALEIHPDHRTTALLVWAALQDLNQQGKSIAAYSYEIGLQSPANRLIDISQQSQGKQRVMQIYVSQNGQVRYPELVLALNTTRTYTLPQGTSHAEAFYNYTPQQLRLGFYEAIHEVIERYREH